MKGKKFLARVLALICFAASALSFVIILAPRSWIEFLPFFPQVERAFSVLIPYTQVSQIPQPYQIYLIPAFLLLSALLFLLFQKALRFWWLIPALYVVYYTLFIFLRLTGKFSTPGRALAVLSSNPFLGQLLLTLALILEGIIVLLFLFLSVRLGRKPSSSKKKQVNRKTGEPGKGKEKEPETQKEMKNRKRKRKEDTKSRRRKEKERPVSPAAEPAAQQVSSEGPLAFPTLKDVPDMPTVGVTRDQGIYMGRLNELSDSSLVLTDVPVEVEVPDEEEEPAAGKRNHLQSLYEHLEQDRMTRDFTVPTRVPPLTSKGSAPEAAVEKENIRESTPEKTEVVPEKRADTSEAAPVKPPVSRQTQTSVQDSQRAESETPQEAEDPPDTSSDDIDYVSGVGGLVRDSSSALLSRSRIGYTHPSEELLDSYPNHSTEVDEETRNAGQRLMDTLREFKIEAKVANIIKGPTVTMYEVTLAPGVRVSSIINLSDNIAMELAAQRVRIVAPIPGKQAVGIEVPNPHRSIIGFRDLLGTVDSHKTPHLPMILGRKITGEPVVMDIARTPHLLIAGATGSGKSVCVNALINSLLYLKSPKEVRLILVDPKIVELRMYNGIPHLLTPVITEPKKTIKALEFCLYEMDRRYKMLNSLAVRNISAYNSKVASQKIARERLPYIVVVIDEFADIMTTVGKELETILARLAAMARAVGIHLVLATQRPSSDVITGTIKSNIPSRIAFTVSGQINSRIIIDENGAEKLLGQGDMLLAPGWEPNSTRIQGAFLSDDEVERVVEYVKTQGEPDYLDESFFEDEVESSDESDDELDDDSDEALREKAIRIIVERNGASASYLQRRLRIGYNKAARIIELLEEEGVVGPSRGSKPRELLRIPD